MSKFNEGDAAYFHKGNNSGGRFGYVKYYVSEVVDGIVYMTDDTDIPEGKLLTEDEYKAVERDLLNRNMRSAPASTQRQFSRIPDVTNADALAAYLNRNIIKDESFNRRVIAQINEVNPDVMPFAAYIAVQVTLMRKDDEDLLNYIDMSKLLTVFDNFSAYEQVEYVATLLQCPIGLLQEAVKGSGRDTTLMRMALLKCLLPLAADMVLFKARCAMSQIRLHNTEELNSAMSQIRLLTTEEINSFGSGKNEG